MVQRTEVVEETPPETSSLIPAASEAVSTELEAQAQNLDAELVELTACMAAGVAKGVQRGKTFLKRYLSLCAGVIVADLAWVAVLAHSLMVHTPIPVELTVVGSGILCLSVLSLPISILWWIRKDWSTEQERDAATGMLAIDDVRAVGPLMEALGLLRKSPLRPSIWQALGRLLPRLTEDEAQALGNTRHYVLASWIQAWDMSENRKVFAGAGEETLLAILPVLAQLGKSSFQFRQTPIPVTARLLPQLKRWTAGKGSGQSSAVQQAAIACREAIEQKMALAQTGAQLLRASAPTPAGADTLLRPTEGASQTDPQELLRPGDSE